MEEKSTRGRISGLMTACVLQRALLIRRALERVAGLRASRLTLRLEFRATDGSSFDSIIAIR
eukprot:1158990-Pelagomonas_calceolata.AAC.5